MRIVVRQAAKAHGAPGPVSDYVEQVIPVRLGETGLAYPARLVHVSPVLDEPDEVWLTFDLIDTEILWNVLTNPHTHAGT